MKNEETATLYRTDGTFVHVWPNRPEFFTLKELQTYVGGMIEIIAIDENRVLVVDEEGKLKGLPENEKATELAFTNGRLNPGDRIVGPALLTPLRYIH